MYCFWAAAGVSPWKHTAHLISDFLYACLCVCPSFKDSLVTPVGSTPQPFRSWHALWGNPSSTQPLPSSRSLKKSEAQAQFPQHRPPSTCSVTSRRDAYWTPDLPFSLTNNPVCPRLRLLPACKPFSTKTDKWGWMFGCGNGKFL